MKTQLLAIAVTMLSGLVISPAVMAGEGGIAAAVVFHLNPSGQVTDAAVAAGIGKNAAVAGAQLDYTSVLTSTTFSSSNKSSFSSEGSNSSSYGGCYYYYYCGGPSQSTNASKNESSGESTNTTTYTPVTNVKAFAVGSAGSLNYNSGGGGYYYYYPSGPSAYIGAEDPSTVGTAQANSFNLKVTTPSISFGN